MSNNQWNGAQDWNAQPQQPNPQDWNAQQPAQDWGQHPVQDWGQQPAQEWGQPTSEQTNVAPAQDWNAQSQSSAQEWGQPTSEQTNVVPAQDWNAQSQSSAQEWGQPAQDQSAQDWNQQAAWGAAPQQQWSQQQPVYGNQQWQGQPAQPKAASTGLSAVFDFGFRGSLLRGNLGTVYMVVAIVLAAVGLMEMIQGFTGEYASMAAPSIGQILWALVGPLGKAFVFIVLARAFLEAMAAIVNRSEGDTNQ